jgi:hypothetical protein
MGSPLPDLVSRLTNYHLILNSGELSSGIHITMRDWVVGVREGGRRCEERVVCLWSRHGGWDGQCGGDESEESEELHLDWFASCGGRIVD